MSSIASRSSRARKPGIRKQPSVTSLFSNLTTSSSGSNSTITQESFNQSRQRASKQMVPKKGTTPKHGPKKPSARLSPSVSPIDERPNVFAFMEKDEDDESVMDGSDIGEVSYSGTSIQQPGMVNELAGRDASPTMSFSSSPQESQYSEDCHHLWNDGMVRASSNSFHSDSGISVRSSSPERDSPILQYKSVSSKNISTSRSSSKVLAKDNIPAASVNPNDTHLPFQPFKVSDDLAANLDVSPEAYYSPLPRPNQHYVNSPAMTGYPAPSRRSSRSLSQQHTQIQTRRKENKSGEAPRIGYDFLASNISASGDVGLKPIYRKFETLNNRMLLYLQDEVSELEEELKRFDSAITQEQKAIGNKAASRRSEMRTPSPLQWRRMEVIARTFAKIEQYNHAVSSYSNLTKSLNPTSQASVDAYKDWIVKNMPLIEQETEFLHHESDLGTIATQPSRTETPASEASLMAPGFTLLSTIITFKLVPYFIARLVVATTALGMVYAFSPATLLNSTMPGNYRRTFAIHLAAVVILALAID